MERIIDNIETRLPRLELDGEFLALLLFSRGVCADGDAGEILEFLLVFHEQIAHRVFDEQGFDLFALETFPVENGFGGGSCRCLGSSGGWRTGVKQ